MSDTIIPVPPVTPPPVVVPNQNLLEGMPEEEVVAYLESQGYTVRAEGDRPDRPPRPPGGGEDNPYPNPGVWTSGGTLTHSIETFGDCNSAFVPGFQAPVTGNTHLSETTTPHGPGWDVICDDGDTSTWNATCKDILLRVDGADQPGTVCQWRTHLYLPAQEFSTSNEAQEGWFTGLVWQFHTDTTNPSLLVDINSSPIQPTPAWRVNIPVDNTNTKFFFGYGPAIEFDVWHELVVQVYWTSTEAGYHRWYIDGELICNYSGPTWWAAGGNPYRQWGYYSGKGGVTNKVSFGPNIREQYAGGLP